MRKWQIAVILLLCGIAGLSWLLYDRLVTRRSPEYIHTHVTPPYEEKARDYYDAHAGELARLAALLPELADGECYDYPDGAGAEIPAELLSVLEELECPDSIRLTRDEILIWIASGTCFDVYLVYGDAGGAYYGVSPEWEKSAPLEDGWSIQAPYVLRG